MKAENKEKIDQIAKIIQELGVNDVCVVQEICSKRRGEIRNEEINRETEGWYILKTEEELEEYRDQILAGYHKGVKKKELLSTLMGCSEKETEEFGDIEATEEEIWKDAHRHNYIVMDKKPKWEELSWELQDRIKEFDPFCGFLQRNKTK